MSALRAAVRWLLLVLACLGACSALAQVAVPALTGHVVDQTGTLSAAQQAQLEQTLAAFEASKGSQVAVLLVPTTQPEAIEPFAMRVAEQWKLGRKKVDDGAILVVAKNDRALRIEVGYGLEGALTDATSKRIIDELIVPRFRSQDFAGGITAGVERMLAVISGEPLPPPQKAGGAAQESTDLRAWWLLPAWIMSVVLRTVLGRPRGALLTAVIVGAGAWWLMSDLFFALFAAVMAFIITLIGAGNLLRGGGGRGGGSGPPGGGGFRGGGGGFGGGGASGRW